MRSTLIHHNLRIHSMCTGSSSELQQSVGIMTDPAKAQTTHVEKSEKDLDKLTVDGYDSYGLVKSTFDDLSIPRTLWVFRRVILVSLAVYTGYVCEGFEVSKRIPCP